MGYTILVGVKSDDMNKKTNIVCPKCLCERTIISSQSISERLCMSCSKKVDRKIINYFDVIDAPNKAYIFGFLWADAWINRTNIRMELQHKDLSALEFIRSEIKEGVIRYRKRKDKRCNKELESSTLDIASTYLSRKLQELDFRKSIKYIDKIYYLDFLRGFLDGDGSITCDNIGKKLGVVFSSNKDENWDHVKTILESFDVNYKVDITKTGSILRIVGSDISKISFLEKLYDAKSFYLDRKKQKFEQYKKCKVK